MWSINFISEEDFNVHVANTIRTYAESLTPYDLKRFNNNIVDPIKLIFDKSVYGLSWGEVIQNEIVRQRDKSNNNSIGYFHQKIFSFISGCEVPKQGWDVIYEPKGGLEIYEGMRVARAFVEMKNKHNTMNSSSARNTYIRMQDKLLNDDDCACMLVEAIAKTRQNEQWRITVDGERRGHRLIRRVSIDRFYEIVTGDSNAFYKICEALPAAIEYALRSSSDLHVPIDTVMQELQKIADDAEVTFIEALYYLAFFDYPGFSLNDGIRGSYQ
ncbi:MAG: Eco47II family restriction endonuclease [Coriobacteriia bacterium]|nr:Eco47II family restriction endonuclease [Coriobacteriia bacterium]